MRHRGHIKKDDHCRDCGKEVNRKSGVLVCGGNDIICSECFYVIERKGYEQFKKRLAEQKRLLDN